MWGQGKCTKDFGGKTVVKKPLAKPRHRCEDSNKMDITETGWNDVVWTLISLTQHGGKWWVFMNIVMSLQDKKN
jgi:hypothetical protein